ncbi:MAG: exonuclease domain-containing protein [Pseudomonadota bacterium]
MTTSTRSRYARDLPTYYYLDNFEELLAFVREQYPHVLTLRHADVLGRFESLPHQAKCLCVRLINRKGDLFALSKLRYAEIDDIPGAAEQLLQAGLIASPEAHDLERLLHVMTKDDVLALAPTAKRTWRKADCVAFVLAQDARPVTIERAANQSFVKLVCDETFAFLKFLFSGRLGEGSSEITLRDLGVMRERNKGQFESRFDEADEALAAFFYARERQRLKADIDGETRAVAARLNDWPPATTESAARSRDKLALSIGRKFEQLGHDDTALAAYQAGESAACVTSAIRLMARSDQHDIRRYLASLIANAQNDEALATAEDIYERRFGERKRSAMTEALANAETINIDELWRGKPERATLEYFKKSGAAVFRAENLFWQSLFGLVFWELLFSETNASGHSPFDAMPAPLVDGSFYTRHQEAIEATLATFATPKQALQRILKTATSHYGQFNGVFRWRKQMLEAMSAVLQSDDAAAVVPILRAMAQDYRAYKSGYPDLVLIDNDAVRFVEVKAPGDHLRRNQLMRLDALRAAGFRAEIVRLNWVRDPNQPYVVVDVETTGGRAANHRVTEIGAVRVVDGGIVERYSTLVNPMRPIPPHITRLTGISNAMVADAPTFAEIADEVSAFIDGAIFCAHNVNFDYGFLKHEFERLGQRFSHPKLCTCATMRATFKGHDSYSLKSLTTAYGISLDSHHRALCDAEAAAQLLMLIHAESARSPND